MLRPLLLAEKVSPLRETGDGLQHIYLTNISETLAQVLIGLSGMDQHQKSAFTEPIAKNAIEKVLVGQQEWEDQEQKKIERDVPDKTTRVALVQARVGQGIFKERVSHYERSCRVTLVDNPAHLIASHIKPWRDSNNEERLHGGNGLLLTPSIDRLFDRGFISFEDSGDLIISPVADGISLKRMGVDREKPPNRIILNSDQRHFLGYHRKEILLCT
jgi:predicted restriction endonuclease